MNNIKIVILALLLCLGLVLGAHPASQVDLAFDKETSLLTVDFAHKVSDSADHFIYEVTIYLNKDEIITQKIEKQETTDGGNLVFKIIDAKPGDKISVKTNCNKSGKKSGELEIE
jgi:hypothetical protein